MAKRAPRTKKTVTLPEFKAWLEGVEELQEKDWVPTASQWKLIRSKIKSIVETPNEQPQQIAQHVPATPPTVHPPSNLPNGIPPMPLPPSSIPMGEVAFTEAAQQHGGLEVKTGQNGEKVLKTPDIDGEYNQSQFS